MKKFIVVEVAFVFFDSLLLLKLILFSLMDFGKIIYLAKLLIPFAFLPIIYWKYGILAGPAIGVNLLATDKNL